jgi:methylthioribose-1-phosphate isomerase
MNNITYENIDELKGSITLLHGVFDPSFFDALVARAPKQVLVMEGRPTLEAAKTSSRELLKRGITPVIITDNMAGFLFYKQLVKEVWLAYQTIDSRGAVCFIGASILGILAKEHSVPVYCYQCAGKKKRALLGSPAQITEFEGTRVAPKKTNAYVPLMEWVPGQNVEESHEQPAS